MVLFQCSACTESPRASFTRYMVCASMPTCVQCACLVCVSLSARARGGLQLVDTADKGWFRGLSLRAYSSSIGGWCVILNNWVTSVQTLSLSVTPNICARSAPSLRRHSLASDLFLCDGAAGVKASQCFDANSVPMRLHLWFNSCIPLIFIWSSLFIIGPYLKSSI